MYSRVFLGENKLLVVNKLFFKVSENSTGKIIENKLWTGMCFNMSEAKKKLKKKMKICESHRTFKRKILTEVRESIDSGESVNQE